MAEITPHAAVPPTIPPRSASTFAPTTAEAFLVDRLKFWDRFTGFTLKTTVGLVVFCAWLWWCGVTSFSLLHIIVLPVLVGLVVMVL